MTDNLVGQTIRGYELRDEIGQGGFGAVYRAFQPVIDREVAIKVILPQYASQPEFIRRFETEAQMVAHLEHPFIIPLYDYWRDPTGAYLVMRWLRGGSLAARLKTQGAMSPADVAHLLNAIGGALAYAHRNGVIHRDLKPDNILLDDSGNPYLADFGIAKDVAHNAPDSGLESISGSPAYIAPEQIKVQAVVPQTDIYSLGMMLFEMLTGEKPFSETLSFSALMDKQLNEPLPLLYDVRPDLPDALDAVLQKATAKDPAERYVDVTTMIKEFEAALEANAPSAAAPVSPISLDEEVELENPYKGLRAFQEADAVDFYGRKALVEQLLNRLGESAQGSHFLAVIGPSGSGKSSVVKAGVLPAVRRAGLPGSDSWFIAEMTPSASPIDQLARALEKVSANYVPGLTEILKADASGLLNAVNRLLPEDSTTQLLLVIDQFEEVFTLIDAEAVRAHLMNSLRVAVTDPASRLRVIVTLRADFVDRPLQYVDFGELIRRRNEFVLPLAPDELREAIVGPAQGVGAAVEDELLTTIVKEVGDQPGALPLLQYALTELFDRRKGRRLTLEAYRASGGVLGALARRAEELYSGLDKDGQEAARQLFLRLVTLGEGTEDTRRRVKRTELTAIGGDQKALNNVIDTYVRYRLLTIDRDAESRTPTIEVAHEALIRTWRRLREWLNVSREDLRIQRRLMAAAAEWNNGKRETSFLASGMRLDQFEGWSKETSLSLGQDEKDYLAASLAERDKQHAQEAARKAREAATARLARNFQAITVVLGIVGVLAVIFVIVAVNQTSAANSQVSTAVLQVALIQSTLTPAQQNLAVANTQVAASGLTLTPAQQNLMAAIGQVATAQTQVAVSGQTLTPARVSLDKANAAVAVANTQVAMSGMTLTPAQQNLIAAVGQVAIAQTQVAVSGQTLTPAKLSLDRANAQVAVAQTQVAVSGQTLTPARLSLDSANSAVAVANTQVAVSGMTLTPAKQQLDAANGLIATANTQVAAAQAQAVVYGLTLTPVQQYLATARGQVAGAQTQVALSGQTLTPVQSTLGAVSTQVAQAGVTLTAQSDNIYTSNRASQADDVLSTNGDPQIAALLSIDGLRRMYAPQVDAALVQAISLRGQVRVFGTSYLVLSGEVSHDGKLVAATTNEHVVVLWDAQSGGLLATLKGHTNAVNDVAFSPDDQQLVSGSSDGTAIIWSTVSFTAIRTLSGVSDRIGAVGWSPDGKTIATGTDQNGAILWDAATGAQIRKLYQANIPESVRKITFAPNSLTLLTAGGTAARLWDVHTGVLQATYQRSPVEVTAIAFAPSGTQILMGGNDGLVEIWGIRDTKPSSTFRSSSQSQATDAMDAVAFSPDANRVAAGSYNNTAYIWSVQDGSLQRTLNGHNAAVVSVSFTQDSQNLMTASNDGSVRLWTLCPSACDSRVWRDHRDSVAAIAVSHHPIRGHMMAATGGSDNQILLWDLVKGTRQAKQMGKFADTLSLEFSPDDSLLLATSSDRIVRLWDLKAQTDPKELTDGKDTAATSAQFTSDGSGILIAEANGLEILDSHTLKPVQVYDIKTDLALLSPDGNYLLAVTGGNVVLYNAHTGSFLASLPVTGGVSPEFAFSPDSRRAAITTGSTVTVLDVATWKPVLPVPVGHLKPVNSVAFSPDGTRFLTTSEDNTARVWDSATGALLRTLVGHTKPVQVGVFSRDGKLVLTGSVDHTVRVWDTDYHDFLTYACKSLSRDLTTEERTLFNIGSGPTCPIVTPPATLTPTPAVTSTATLTPTPR
ncbi:MAG TPA: protein kinase [Aggregatilineales bacterium]|nr:protein kinase [Aggregatilineales bacterium]